MQSNTMIQDMAVLKLGMSINMHNVMIQDMVVHNLV